MSEQILLLGSGIAALSAAEAVRERSLSARITMVSEEAHPPYSRPGLAYLLRGDVPPSQLALRPAGHLESLGVVRVVARADRLDCQKRELHLEGGGMLPYDRILLATGALAAPPPFGGEGLRGVVKLDSLDDTLQILSLARGGGAAVVVGGGITALELAEGLAARGMKVHYFLRGERYWSDILDEEESRIVLARLEHEGVRLHLRTQVQRVLEERGAVSGVETSSGEVVRCRVLAYAIGVRPRVELARAAGLKVDRGVVVDDRMRASIPGVFAAGDCAQVGSSPLDVLWPTALEQGRIAGANLAGEALRYRKKAACNVTCLAGLKVTVLGAMGSGVRDPDRVAIVRGDSERWRAAASSWLMSTPGEVSRVRLAVGGRALIGALVMGSQEWSRPLQRLIDEEADLTPIRAQLAQGGSAALEHLARFLERRRG